MNHIFLLFFKAILFVNSSEISFTMDDPTLIETPLLKPLERNAKILEAFDQFKIKGALFVCGMRIDEEQGRKIISDWDNSGHIIANHTYSHKNFNKEEVSFNEYREDFFKVEPLIKNAKNFTKLFRFPFLKEGNTKEKRDLMRAFLKDQGYQNGHVTIDASDWYVEMRLKEKLKKNPKADLTPYKNFYLKHIWERANYYNDLALKVYGREIKHTLLIHHNLLNSLFLADLMQMFKDKGWKLISASEAFSDSIYSQDLDNVPAGEGLVWAKARESGKFEDSLRYPAESDKYEEEEMNKLGL